MIYHRPYQIEFGHCDPAGIVFYPRYFEMANSVVENFFADVLGYPFRRIHMIERSSVPTVRIEAEFRAPSRLGDVLEFTVEIVRVGHSSVQLVLSGGADGAARLQMRIVLVWVSPDGKAAAWPAEIRQKMTAFKEEKFDA